MRCASCRVRFLPLRLQIFDLGTLSLLLCRRPPHGLLAFGFQPRGLDAQRLLASGFQALAASSRAVSAR